MKHSSVNGLVNEQTVQEMFDMFVENSRKYLDNSPSLPDAQALQFKGKDRKNSQGQSTGKIQQITLVIFVALRIIG